MRITAKVDYAVRAVAVLCAVQLQDPARRPTTADVLAEDQEIPLRYLAGILADLRRAGIVGSQRGSEGGYWMARPAGQVSVADVIRAVEGPLADVHGSPPESVAYRGPAEALQRVWIATRSALRDVLEATSMADVVTGHLPAHLEELVARPGGWTRR